MKEIEVGEYVRTKNGVIDRVDALHGMMENTVHLEKQKWFDTKNIVKHSKNLIDLIEVGDLIIYKLRGLKHQGKGFIRIYKDARSGKENLGIDNYSLEQIEIIKILTHEQIEANCYKVGGEDENRRTNKE